MITYMFTTLLSKNQAFGKVDTMIQMMLFQ